MAYGTFEKNTLEYAGIPSHLLVPYSETCVLVAFFSKRKNAKN